MDVKIESSWKEALKEEFQKSYFEQIVMFLKHEKALGKPFTPWVITFSTRLRKPPSARSKWSSSGKILTTGPDRPMGFASPSRKALNRRHHS